MHGWLLKAKPPEFKDGEKKKKWPVVLLIHGGAQCFSESLPSDEASRR